MLTSPVSPVFQKFNISQKPFIKVEKDNKTKMVEEFCSTFELPSGNRNHANFDEKLVQKIASYKDESTKAITGFLQNSKSEKDITACLFLINRLIDAGAQNIKDSYHIFSKYNYEKSPNIQVMLAGIYRKTLVPDGFGPLITMLINNSKTPTITPFDPNEEVGGAILEYLRTSSAINNYEVIKR